MESIELLLALAAGLGGQQIGLLVGVRVVDGEGDDAVVGEPAVVDGFHIAFAVEFHAENGFVVHGADNPVAGAVAVHHAGVIDARRRRLIDAVSGGESVLVVAQRKIADALLRIGSRAAFGVALAAESGGAVGFVGDEHLRRCAGHRQGVGDAASALVSAENDADAGGVGCPLLNPGGDFGRVGSNFALDFGCADIAVVQRWVQGGVAGAFFGRVIAGGFVGADGQGAQGDGGVLEVFAPDLRDQGDGGAHHDGELAGRG